jgi:hypothetical protein
VGQSVAVDLLAMEEYISQLLESESLREEMGRKAREHVLRNYAWEKIVRQYEALWEELRAIADSLPPIRGQRISFFEPCYFDYFCNFASDIVDETRHISLTEEGKRVSKDGQTLPVYNLLHDHLDTTVLIHLLNTLRVGGWLTKSFPVGGLLEEFARKHKLSKQEVFRHLMWLAKYGFVAFNEPRTS